MLKFKATFLLCILNVKEVLKFVPVGSAMKNAGALCGAYHTAKGFHLILYVENVRFGWAKRGGGIEDAQNVI